MASSINGDLNEWHWHFEDLLAHFQEACVLTACGVLRGRGAIAGVGAGGVVLPSVHEGRSADI